MLSVISYGQKNVVSIDINDSVNLKMGRVLFDTTGKTIEYYKGTFPFAIDGRPLFGTDGDIPKYQLSHAILTIGQQKYDLQVDNMYNPWFSNKPYVGLFSIKKDGNQFRLRAIFSDGAGSYMVEWLMVGKSSIMTMITKDDSEYDKFYREDAK